MASNQLYEINGGFVDIRRNPRGSNAGDPNSRLSTPGAATPGGAYSSIAQMRTRLAVINAAYYTAARLDQMSANDMVWALRQSDDAGSIR